MPLQFYSPNKSNTGAAMSVSFNSKDQAVYFNFIKQTSWDNTTSKGSFKGGATANAKFSLDEIGSFIYAIRNKEKANFYHSFNEETTKGSLTYYEFDRGGKIVSGFGFTLNKNDVDFKVGLNFGAAEKLMEYLKFALDHCFSAIYAEDKKKFQEKQNEKEKPQNKPDKENLEKSVEEKDFELF